MMKKIKYPENMLVNCWMLESEFKEVISEGYKQSKDKTGFIQAVKLVCEHILGKPNSLIPYPKNIMIECWVLESQCKKIISSLDLKTSAEIFPSVLENLLTDINYNFQFNDFQCN